MDTIRIGENIGEQLRQLRVERGITQRQLAAQTRLSQQTISSIEVSRMEPSLATLDTICRCLGVTIIINGGDSQ